MSSNIPFSPVRGTQQAIDGLPKIDGRVYYAYDTGKIYLDKDATRYPMSGGSANGASFFYGTFGKEIEQDETTEKYYYPIEDVEKTSEENAPKINDIILDEAGFLYRILEIGEINYGCSLLPLSGNGGGEKIDRPTVQILSQSAKTIVNGEAFSITIKVKSALDENKAPLADELDVTWSLVDVETNQTYYKSSTAIQVPHEGEKTLFLGDFLKPSTKTKINIEATGMNHTLPSAVKQTTVDSVEMYLETYNYSPTTLHSMGQVKLECYAVGALPKIIEWKFDGQVIHESILDATSDRKQDQMVPSDLTTHGPHTVEINLYQNIGSNADPVKGVSANPLKYEIIVRDPNNIITTPIIILGDYQSTYYNYDTIQIPFFVYNPKNTGSAEVNLFKEDVEIDGSPRTITDFSGFSYWQIADAEINKENYYSITCGTAENNKAYREIKFTVVEDTTRNMNIYSESLKLNFDPIGRSNSEPAIKRASWSYGEGVNKINAQFNNFNWYNNGWYLDSETKNTFLRISNGAEFIIPFEQLTFGTSDVDKQSNSIEIAFKMRNIQNYENLITNVTRYTCNGESDEKWYTDFMNQSQYTNYDAYLQAKLTPEQYESLEFKQVQKNINLNNIACGFYSGDGNNVTGICIGPQDAFFSNGTNTVNVPFVENEMVYLSFVYEHNLKLMFIYINGVITGVIRSTADIGGFKIGSSQIVFNSNKCDIDLYKLRIYSSALDVSAILHNYAVDKKDISIYDQNLLGLRNSILGEYQLSFNDVKDYIDLHPDKPLMPYIIFDTTESNTNDKLPYAKAIGTTNIKVDFVNVPLDAAYNRGELIQKAVDAKLLSKDETNQDIIDAAVKLYYKHNCPSWTSTMSADDVVTIEVQGTSSEFYPRRNFKIKTKYEKANCWDETLTDDEGNAAPGYSEEDCLNIFMNKGPYEDIYLNDKKHLQEDEHYYGYEESRLSDGWYMNNYTNPTDRWTMKVDYMESSGSYNAGFASLMGTAYTKHPLEDYVNANLLTNTDKLKSSVYNTMRWEDYRTSLLGFPVMAFQKRWRRDSNNQKTDETEYLFIGYYRMLLDKGSEEVLGFKTNKNIQHTLLNEKLRDVAECWEFSTNARTFCSYRDPWNRVEFSFKAPKSEGTNGFIKLESGKIGGPMVLNHFEPRYFKYEDYLKNDEDGFYNFGDLTQDKINAICDDLGIDRISISDPEIARDQAQDAAVNLMSNWEKVCKWIYSTNLDNVKSQGVYNEIPVGLVEYTPGIYWIIDESSENGYSISNEEFNPELTYYTIITDENNQQSYVNAYATLEKYIYKKNTFYIQTAGAYSLCPNEYEDFDSSLTYYEFKSLEDAEIAEIADLLVAPAITYDASTIYYTYDKEAKVNIEKGITNAVQLAGTDGHLTEEEFSVGSYYIAAPVSYDGKTSYAYDTKEYRTAKFINELSNHFDLEYLATYFIMTEVFECYDSRGKNCMMASWGPLKDGGDYIWYPIFYDIDTQLGINNTGIPSFEFNVDATEAGNYSTSDSILWNNFYKFFKGSVILNKYKNLRGIDSNFKKLANPPLESVDNLEKWYTFNPEVTNNIANRGERPLIATNLDMYFKYITITNANAIKAGVAYIAGADGEYAIDSSGTYYYALQGDRSQSRRQFLTNRIEYIDSWLNQKNYARGGNNRIRGRISANKPGTISDEWIETDSNPYWQGEEFISEKTHDFDSEYWLTLRPIRSSYVTAGDDSANYPSQKYTGLKDINFKLYDIESGIRRSQNYPEQLVYIYGMNQMADYVNMHKLYWTEFYMEGNANHLTRLCLGYDGTSKTDPGVVWYNQKLNGITLAEEMPLLKEANFSNITIQNNTTLNLTKSEKLENFRATGTSHLTSVQFADGVALNTLYLPSSVTNLKLIQANLLNNLIAEADTPRPTNNDDGTVTPPEQGLFIEGFFGDVFNSSITSIYLDGGALGHDSYKLLKRFYDVILAKETTQVHKITMTGVNWSPYKQLTEGAIYDNSGETIYYIDNKHYGFDIWSPDASKFNDLVLNGRLYLYTEGLPTDIDNNFKQLLLDLNQKTSLFNDAASSNRHPTISGIVYVHNDTEGIIEESYIRETLQPIYPNLKFFFKNVTKAYSAEFLYKNPITGADEYVKFADGITSGPSVQKIAKEEYENGSKTWFDNPFELYLPKRTHYVFKGWSLNPNASPDSDEVIKSVEEWDALSIDENTYDYIYYAIFEIDKYNVIFYDGDGKTVLATKSYDYGTVGIEIPEGKVPYKDDSLLSLTNTYGFLGYTDNTLTNKIIDMKLFTVRGESKLYPVFEEMSVYDNIHPEYFGCSSLMGDGVVLTLEKNVRGKLTIPATIEYEGKTLPVYSINYTFATVYNGINQNGKDLTHVFFDRNTVIKQFGTYAFCGGVQSSLSKLKFVEFPDSLLFIQSNAFLQCKQLDYTEAINTTGEDAPRITGANVQQIAESAFQQAFASKKIENLRIGASVSMIGKRAFYNTQLSYAHLTIGTAIKLSALDFTYNSDDIIFNINVGSDKYQAHFYSEKYNAEDEESLFAKKYFTSCSSLTIV